MQSTVCFKTEHIHSRCKKNYRFVKLWRVSQNFVRFAIVIPMLEVWGGYLNLKTLVANFDMYYIIFLLHVDVNNVYLYK